MTMNELVNEVVLNLEMMEMFDKFEAAIVNSLNNMQ